MVLRSRMNVEALEDRCVPDCKTISGHVFNDLNNDGIRSANEPLLANSPIELRNAAGVIIGRTTTNDNGFYLFDTDATVDSTPRSITHSGTMPETRTNSTQTLDLPKFDPDFGELQSVEIRINGHVTSTIRVENLDPSSAVIDVTVAGRLTVTGPGFASLVTTNTNTKTFNALTYDGTTDFGGTSGKDFGPVTVTGASTQTITKASDVASYVGTGTVTFAGIAQASSSATAGGNLNAVIGSTGGADITIIYHYVPSNCIQPGDYVILQTNQPTGYLDGQESANGVLVPNSVGTDRIAVTLANEDLVDNDFGELLPAKVGGYVYFDVDNDGVKDVGENGISGTTIKLTGTNDLGQQIAITQKTLGDGSYEFGNLRPGTYSLTETQPSGYLDGKDTVGTIAANLANDAMTQIKLNQGAAGANFNFGEIKPGSLAGFVYHDEDQNGRKGKKEPGIADVTVTLTGTDDLGNAIVLTKKTNSKGAYKFANLRPGTYVITETQPAGYKDGAESLGSLDGTVGADTFTQINLPVAKAGVDYNFGELKDGGGGSQGITDPVSKIYFLASVILQKARS